MHAVLTGLKIASPGKNALAFVGHDREHVIDHHAGEIGVGAVVPHVYGSVLLGGGRRESDRAAVRRLEVRVCLPVHVDRNPVRMQARLAAPGYLAADIASGVLLANSVPVPEQNRCQRLPSFRGRLRHRDRVGPNATWTIFDSSHRKSRQCSRVFWVV